MINHRGTEDTEAKRAGKARGKPDCDDWEGGENAGVIVYGDPKTRATVGEAVAALRGLKGRELVVACGMLEQGLADAGLATGDFVERAARSWLDAGEFVWEELRVGKDVKLDLKTPEGFAFYQLYPEQYLEAAREFLKAKGAGEYVVIGIRSIGTSLSAVVAETLRLGGARVTRCTVRTRGDPFAREVELPSWVGSGAEGYLVVDEGPGMSGSSFVATYDALVKLGVRGERIHFFTGHGNGPGAAASEEVLNIWKEASRWFVPLENISWKGRRNIFEFLKEREREFDFPVIWKFVGQALPWPFDCSGEAERCARRAAEVSCGAPVLDAVDGWIAFPFIDGRSAKVTLQALAKHILATADEALRREDEIETEGRLREMLAINVRKHFGNAALDENLRRWLESLVIGPAEKSSGDGHMAPRNWVVDPSGKLWKFKTTGSKLSHHVAYRLPALWDVAQVLVQWDLRGAEEDELCAELRAGGMRVEAKELAFFEMACAALELGKCVMFGGVGAATKRFERRLLRTMQEQFAW